MGVGEWIVWAWELKQETAMVEYWKLNKEFGWEMDDGREICNYLVQPRRLSLLLNQSFPISGIWFQTHEYVCHHRETP